jgi:hypothetical protein
VTGDGVRWTHLAGHSVVATLGGVDVLTYVFAADDPQRESPRPYLHPVRSLGGTVVTAFRPASNPWHKGISLAIPHVGEDNFWGGPTFIRGQGYVQLANNGSIVHLRLRELAEVEDALRLVHELAWRTADGRTVIEEVRKLVVAPLGDDAWVLGFASELTNCTSTELALGSPALHGRPEAGYGGLFWRGPDAFRNGTACTVDGAGDGAAVRGKRAPWMSYSGGLRGGECTLVFVDLQDNPGHPSEWFVRSAEYAGGGPAPLYSAPIQLAPGRSLALNYRLAIADGSADAERRADLAARANGDVYPGAPERGNAGIGRLVHLGSNS